MSNDAKLEGVVVPMVTPLTTAGGLDFAAADRLVEFLLAGGVHGVFVLGTTGEGVAVPPGLRLRLVEHTAHRVGGRALLYAGLGHAPDARQTPANDCFQAGADAVVAHPPVGFEPTRLLAWYETLLERLTGPLILYNIPSVARVSIPLDLLTRLIGHPRLAGVKDSENDRPRLSRLLRQFGRRSGFSVFVGVGALMEEGLRLGAQGIVPSVGNLDPATCRDLFVSAKRGDWAAARRHAERLKALAALYQNGRTLGESLATLKAALHCLGLCEPCVLPPLQPLTGAEMATLRHQMARLHLLN